MTGGKAPLTIKTVRFVHAAELIPSEWWGPKALEVLADNAPYTWGDCEHSLITRLQFIDWVADRLDRLVSMQALIEWEDWVQRHVPVDVMIDLEGKHADTEG